MTGSTPRARVTAAIARDGEREFVLRCVRLLDGEIDPALVEEIGGDGATYVLDGHEGGPDGYWPRTWALRALLYAWDPLAEPAVIGACGDDHWRVREMAAKVIAARLAPSVDTGRVVDRLATDGNSRVRAAAERARAKLA
ncbi:hypothetical protein [Flexivirga sp. B27]